MSVNSVCVQNIFAFGRTNVAMVEWDINLTDVHGQQWQNKGVTVINVKKGKVVLVRNYIFDLEVHRKTWGEGC